MKNLIKTSAAVIALTAVFAGPASAMVSKGELNRDIASVLGGDSSVTVNVDYNGLVTLSGYYGDASDKYAAIRTAELAEGVTGVVNNAFQSN